MTEGDPAFMRSEILDFFKPAELSLLAVTRAACGEIPAAVRHLYLSHSMKELLCFAHYHPWLLKRPENVAFVAFGPRLNQEQVRAVCKMYPNAKVHTIFACDTVGKVYDCLVALWMKRKTATFRVKEELVEIGYKSRNFSIPEPELSLSRFSQLTGLRSGVHTHKPKNGYITWAEMFRFNYGL